MGLWGVRMMRMLLLMSWRRESWVSVASHASKPGAGRSRLLLDAGGMAHYHGGATRASSERFLLAQWPDRDQKTYPSYLPLYILHGCWVEVDKDLRCQLCPTTSLRCLPLSAQSFHTRKIPAPTHPVLCPPARSLALPTYYLTRQNPDLRSILKPR